jgi:2-C-methyl-D-erythritol 4-phosphate cytidylyltransferase
MPVQDQFWALIPAAGVGQRAGGEVPKQYARLHGKPLLEHTLRRLDQCAEIAGLVVCLQAHDTHWGSVNRSIIKKPLHTVTGGATRAQSVLNGLRWLRSRIDGDDFILVHDAVRPCVTCAEIHALIQACREHPVGGLLGLPVVDTLKSVTSAQQVSETVSRQNLWRALTPQMFRHTVLCQAIEQDPGSTDEASAMENAGYKPLMVKGQNTNIKLTYPDDFSMIEFLLSETENL